MSTNREDAEVLATALEVGIVDVPEAVAWAVERIVEEAHPHWSLCEVATASARYPQDVAAMLRAIPGQFSQEIVRRRVISMMGERLIRDHALANSIASALYQLALADEIVDYELRSLAWWAWDRLDLADQGTIVETREQVIDQMIHALSRYSQGAEDTGPA